MIEITPIISDAVSVVERGVDVVQEDARRNEVATGRRRHVAGVIEYLQCAASAAAEAPTAAACRSRRARRAIRVDGGAGVDATGSRRNGHTQQMVYQDRRRSRQTRRRGRGKMRSKTRPSSRGPSPRRCRHHRGSDVFFVPSSAKSQSAST